MNKYVVHCKKSPYDVYIGRNCYGMPKGEVSLWGNPFVMKNQTNEERIRISNQYREWVYSQPDLIIKIKKELRGKVLGCFCAPKSCHGNILAEIANSDDIDTTTISTISALPAPPPLPTTTIETTIETQQISSSTTKITTSQKSKKKKSQLDNYKSLLSIPSVEETTLTLSDTSIQSNQIIETNDNLKSDNNSSNLLQSTVIDIGINITNSQMKSKWKSIIHRAVDSGVSHILLTGTTAENSKESILIANQWFEQTKKQNLFCTVGIHPHYANTYNETTDNILRNLIEKNSSVNNSNTPSMVVAVGECGLDFFRNLSPQEIQIKAFRKQIEIAIEYNLPIFVHDREATPCILDVFSAVSNNFTQSLPPIVIHCFTGTQEEMLEYISKGFYIGITGVICKHQRGKQLRDMLPLIPLDRIMIETDAPYMGFLRERRSSEPCDVVKVAEEIGRVLNRDINEIREILYRNTITFFRLPEIE